MNITDKIKDLPQGAAFLIYMIILLGMFIIIVGGSEIISSFDKEK